MTTKPAPNVHVGQLWADNDPRSAGRYLRVLSLDETHATCLEIAYSETDRAAGVLPEGRRTRIRIDRMRPTRTGYRLVQDVDTEPGSAG